MCATGDLTGKSKKMALFNNKFIIPDTNGAMFDINTENREQLEKVVTVLIHIPEVKKIIFNCDVHPHLITVHARKLLRVNDFLHEVEKAGFHASQRV